MHTYHVTYFYLATGMEGHADRRDYGYVKAWSQEEAVNMVAKIICGKDTQDIPWVEGCLTATQKWTDFSKINEI